MASLSVGASAGAVGLDIGTDHVRLAQIKPSGSSFALQRYGVVRLPMGSVVEGEIVDADAVASAIRQLMRTTGLGSAHVAIGVSNQKVVVRLIDLPYMEDAELQGAIRYQAQDYIPIPVEEAIMDFQIIGDYMTSADEHMNEVLLVAAQRDMIDATVAAVERSGLKLSAIDVTPFAVVRAIFGIAPSVLPGDDEAAGEATAVIHMSAGITNIVVVEKGIPRFTRVSGLAANELTQSVATALGVTFDEAEDLKIRVGLPNVDETGVGEDLPSDIDPERARAAQEALELEVSKFIAEVRRSLDYYLTQTAQVRAIRRILLTGSGAKLRNLDSYIERGLHAKVELADPLKWLQVPQQYKALIEADRLGATAAVGLAMGSVVA